MIKKKILTGTAICLLTAALTGCSLMKNEDYDNAVNSFNSGNYESACIYMEKVLEDETENADYYIFYGMCLVGAGKNEEALDAFDKAIVDTDNKIIRENKKKALRGKGIALFGLARYEQASECFYDALEIREESYLDPDIKYYLQDSLFEGEDYENALKVINELLERKKDALLYYKKAKCEYMLDKFEESVGDFDTAIVGDSKNVGFYFGKYQALVQLGRFDDAEETMNTAMQYADIDKEEDDISKARLLFLTKDYDEAVPLLKKALKKENYQAAYYLGVIARKNKQISKAREYMLTYIESEASLRSSAAFSEIITDDIYTRRYEDALSYFEDALKIKDGFTQTIRFNQIIVYERMGKYQEAYELVKEYCKDYPSDNAMKKEAEFIKTRLPGNEG